MHVESDAVSSLKFPVWAVWAARCHERDGGKRHRQPFSSHVADRRRVVYPPLHFAVDSVGGALAASQYLSPQWLAVSPCVSGSTGPTRPAGGHQCTVKLAICW